MDNRVERERKKTIEKVSEFFIVVGISIITAIISIKILPNYEEDFSKILIKFSGIEFWVIIASIILIVESIYVYSKPKRLEGKIIPWFLWPYILILPVILQFYMTAVDGTKLTNMNLLVFFLFLLWLGIFYELIKFIKSANIIMKEKIKEDKERLAIIITIIATIISALAIFK